MVDFSDLTKFKSIVCWLKFNGPNDLYIFEGQPFKTRPFPTKTRVIWVPGIYNIHQESRSTLHFFTIITDLGVMHPIVAPDLLQKQNSTQKTGVIKRNPFRGGGIKKYRLYGTRIFLLIFMVFFSNFEGFPLLTYNGALFGVDNLMTPEFQRTPGLGHLKSQVSGPWLLANYEELLGREGVWLVEVGLHMMFVWK